jgi:diguanylate cyclase (GGDEF)-like protein
MRPDSTPSSRWPARVGAALRRSGGLVEQTRRLFAVSVVLSMLSVLPKPLLTMEAGLWPVAGSAALVAVAGWVRRYRTRRDPLGADFVEVGALVAMAVAFPVAVTVYVFAFAAIWFRALYGSPARAVLYCGLVSLGLMAAAPVWARVHDGDPVAQAISMAVPLPALWLTMLVARALARSLFAREQAQRRDAARVELGHRLIGRTERAGIRADGRRCLAALCAATPGMRAMVLVAGPDGAVVHDHAGWSDPPPARLPAALLPGGGPTPTPTDGLRELFGAGTGWSVLTLPGDSAGWIALGAPGAVPAEAVIAVQSLANQVALALRTSEAHRELAAQALVDPLTGLANRAAFTAALERQRAEHAPGVEVPFAVLFLDLDDFKTVNDRMGHPAGDELLRQVAARLRGGLRPRDVCARLGGDEFAVLMPDSGDTAHAVAHRLVERVSAPVPLNGCTVRVAASVGLAFGSAGLTAEELVQRADTAMYAAKARGKNRVEAFDPGLLGGPAPFEAELATAAAGGQLVVHYQPIVSVVDEQCVAVEALVRWQHPSRGLLSPAEFVPAAERTGDIVAIGAHVLRQACAEGAAWAGPAGPLAVHVNVSAAQLSDGGFREVVRGCLADTGLAGGRLVLEITESAVLDSPAIGPALDGLIELGALIAIDDFGTGYSALTTLRTLPLDIVKIDRSFLAGFPDRPADGVAVEAIVELAGRLGLRIVAEGVERADQQLFLRRVGADAAQGYLHLRPVPAAEFVAWLAGRDQRIEAVPAGGAQPARAEVRVEVDPAGRRRTG